MFEIPSIQIFSVVQAYALDQQCRMKHLERCPVRVPGLWIALFIDLSTLLFNLGSNVDSLFEVIWFFVSKKTTRKC